VSDDLDAERAPADAALVDILRRIEGDEQLVGLWVERPE